MMMVTFRVQKGMSIRQGLGGSMQGLGGAARVWEHPASGFLVCRGTMRTYVPSTLARGCTRCIQPWYVHAPRTLTDLMKFT